MEVSFQRLYREAIQSFGKEVSLVQEMYQDHRQDLWKDVERCFIRVVTTLLSSMEQLVGTATDLEHGSNENVAYQRQFTDRRWEADHYLLEYPSSQPVSLSKPPGASLHPEYPLPDQNQTPRTSSSSLPTDDNFVPEFKLFPDPEVFVSVPAPHENSTAASHSYKEDGLDRISPTRELTELPVQGMLDEVGKSQLSSSVEVTGGFLTEASAVLDHEPKELECEDAVENVNTEDVTADTTSARPPRPKKTKRKVDGYSYESGDSSFRKKKWVKREHDPNRPRPKPLCHVCGKDFSRRDYLHRHMIDVHGINGTRVVYTCDICGQGFRHRSNFLTHKRNHDKGPFACQTCGKVFTIYTSYKYHVQIHEGLEFPCDICHKVFPSKMLMTKHKRKVHFAKQNPSLKRDPPRKRNRGQPRLCNECGKSFNRPDTLKQHLLFMHGQGNAPLFTCDMCGEVFRYRSTLWTHKRKHNNIRVPCEICGKTFTTVQSMRNHAELHENLEYACDICSKIFKTKSMLTDHRRRAHISTPPTLRPHTCNICGDTLSNKYTLETHMKRRHSTDGKPFSCETCKKSFENGELLLRHQNVHTAERPFVCDMCPSSFSRQDTLKSHMRTHLKIPVARCDVCGKPYMCRKAYLAHVKSNICGRQDDLS